jgi:ABC-type antimicrobial peptide transport system permease subunit
VLFVFDLIRIVFAKWKNSKRLVALTVFNLSVGLCVLLIFVNAGFNISRYVSENFFSDERLRHVLISDAEGVQISSDANFLKDESIESARIIYASNLDAIMTGEIAHSNVANLNIAVLGSENLVFEGEYGAVDTIVERSEATGWKDGVVVSERILVLFGEESPLGQLVTFRFNGIEYSLPITGIMSSSAEESYDVEYRSSMYVLSSNLESLPDGFEMAELRLNEMGSVKRFVEAYDTKELKIISSIPEIEHLLVVMRTIVFLLCVTGVLFALLSTTGIINCLTYMQDINLRSMSLLKIIGFSQKNILSIDIVESMTLGILGCFASILLFLPAAYAMKFTGLFSFEFITTDTLFAINRSALIFCLCASLAVVVVCKLLVLRKVKNEDILESFKSER